MFDFSNLEKTMNIDSPEGTKVKTTVNLLENGLEYDKRIAKAYLDPGKVYTVDYTVVGSSCTDVYLKEFPGVMFNSVNLTEV